MFPIPFMHFRFKNQIHHIAGMARVIVPNAPVNGIDQSFFPSQLALEMPPVRPDAASGFDKCMGTGKNRFRIVRPARFQQIQRMNKINGHFVQRNGFFHFQHRNAIFRSEPFSGIFIEPPTEFWDIFFGNREPCGHFVAPILEQQIPLGCQGFINIERPDGTARPFPDAISNSQNQHRPMVSFQNARRYDTNDPWMPIFPIHHQGHIVFNMKLRNTFLGFCINFSFNLLARHIGFAQPIGQHFRLFHGRGGHQFHPFFGMGNTARCIETGRQTKGHLIGPCHCFRIFMDNTRRPKQSRQSANASSHEPFHSFSHQDAVFSRKRHHIGHGTQGCQFHIVGVIFPKLFQMQGPAHHEGHAAARQFLVWIRAILLVGIDHCDTLGQCFRRCMVVRHNDIQRSRPFRNQIGGTNPAVHRNE